MTSRVAWWGAWSLALVTCLIAIARVVLAIVDPAASDQSSATNVFSGGVPIAAFETVVLITIAVIGSVVAARQPRNVVGWILCVIPLSLGVLIVSSHVYWSLRFHDIGSERLAAIVAWLGSWTWVPVMIPTATFFPLLFPTGRPLTPRWRPVVWMAGVTLVLVLFTELFRPGRLQEFPVANPFGVDIATGVFVNVSDVFWVTTTVAAMTSIVIRFRRSHGDERQQIKWVALAALMFVLLFILSAVIQDLQGEDVLGFAILLVGLLLIASAVALAVLRYRLYDIDVVINRALVYGSLTAMLAAVYLASVLLLQVVLETFTGGSGLAVAASTLGTAALFGPLRRRTQAVVDRRFFRRKYDAAQTLQRFAASVRDEVDLEALTTELRTVIAETMQPAHLSLWVHTREGSR
jgi:hypothetical protein